MNKNLQNKKPVTLELLAERLEMIDKRFDVVDKRFDTLESGLDTKIGRLDAKIDGLGETMERCFKEVYVELEKIDTKIDERFDALSKEKVSYKIYDRQNKVFDDRLVRLENVV